MKLLKTKTMTITNDKWYIKSTEPTPHKDGGFVVSVKIHFLYRFFIWLGLAKTPVINSLDLFGKLKGTTAKNPYQLTHYKQGWSKTRTEKNNKKYWLWEILHNNFRPNFITEETIEKLKKYENHTSI